MSQWEACSSAESAIEQILKRTLNDAAADLCQRPGSALLPISHARSISDIITLLLLGRSVP